MPRTAGSVTSVNSRTSAIVKPFWAARREAGLEARTRVGRKKFESMRWTSIVLTRPGC